MGKLPIVEVIQQALYKKSSNPFAEENLNDDFQDGYSKGMKSDMDADDHKGYWRDAWENVYHKKHSEGWENWKRGWHSARLSRVTLTDE